MKQIISLLLISLLIVNCEEGGDGGSSSPSGNFSKVEGNYIPDDYNDLGQIAQFLIDNDPNFDQFYNAVNAGDGAKAHGDSQILFAVRGFVNSRALEPNINGTMDVTLENPMDAFTEALWDADNSSRGVTRQGLCYLTADIYESFRIQTRVVTVTGATHALATNGTYCVVEALLPHGTVMIDPYLNRTFNSASVDYHSVEDILVAVDNQTLNEIFPNPDGFGNALPGWTTNDYYHTFETLFPANADGWDAARELYDTTFDAISYQNYNEIR